MRRIFSYWTSIKELFRYFAGEKRYVFIPFLIILALAGILFAMTQGGLAYVAPFLYTLF